MQITKHDITFEAGDHNIEGIVDQLISTCWEDYADFMDEHNVEDNETSSKIFAKQYLKQEGAVTLDYELLNDELKQEIHERLCKLVGM